MKAAADRTGKHPVCAHLVEEEQQEGIHGEFAESLPAEARARRQVCGARSPDHHLALHTHCSLNYI